MPWIRNDNGETPLLVATHCRSTAMVKCVIEQRGQMLWTFGPVTCNRYPLFDIETIAGWAPGAHRI